ncbi:MAG: type II toxin-antitoxin system VapC family toxin [Verrucomicrobiota bacterium]
MKFIIDTQIFLWALAEPQKLSDKQRCEIESEANTVYLSSISIAEIMIKASLGKLTVTFDPLQEAEQCGFTPLDFSGHAAISTRHTSLPPQRPL